MKVLIAADIFPPQSGGPATYVVSLANAMRDRGMDVRIVSLNPDSDRSIVRSPLSIVRHRNKFLRYVEYTWLLWKYAQKADVIYAMGPVNAGLPALLAAWLRERPLVVKVVGDYAWEQGVQRFGVTDSIDAFQQKTCVGAVYWLKRIQSLVVRRAARVIVPCKYLKHMVEGWGAESRRVCVVYNAILASNAAPVPKPAGERWIVSAGRFVPWKGMDALVDVLVRMPDIKLKLVGDGPEREKIMSRISNLKLDQRVELVGNLPHARALSYIRSADVFALNSGYEGLSHVLLEAIAFGVPVVASSSGGNPEIVNAETAGALFAYNNREELREKLLWALAQPRQPARPLSEQFQFPKMIERAIDILKSVCPPNS